MVNVENIKNAIANNTSEVLIASNRLYETLADNLINVEVTQFCNGIIKYAKLLNTHFRGFKGALLLLDDYKSNKHLGNIKECLKAMNREVLCAYLANSYECDSNKHYEVENDKIIIVSDFLAYLNFAPVVVGVGWHYNVLGKYINLPSYFYSPRFHAHYASVEALVRTKTCLEILSFVNAYIVVSNKRSYEVLSDFLERNNGNKERILKLGYPSFDLINDNDMELQKDSVIFSSVGATQRFAKISQVFIEALLNANYRVVYKVHNGHNELESQEREFCAKWRECKNFIYYDIPNLSNEELKRSITLVEFRSSLLYTYPLITGKPSIIIVPDFINNAEDNFYEERLHIKVHSTEELLEVLQDLQDENLCQHRQKMIEDYRINETYYFKQSSQKIAEFIDNYIKRYC